jgi:hypothetical protein
VSRKRSLYGAADSAKVELSHVTVGVEGPEKRLEFRVRVHSTFTASIGL